MKEGTSEVKAALRWVWLIVTLATSSAAAMPFFAGAPAIARVVPVCSSKAAGGRCLLCGATTGFIHIAHGEWRDAEQANDLAIPLFAAFALNGVCAGFYFGGRARCRF